MFTTQTQTILEQAKRDAWAQGAKELELAALLAAVAQHAEGRVLLARCVQLPVEKLRERFPAPGYQGTFFAGSIRLSSAVQAVLSRAASLAAQEPDRSHPGYIALRHLAGALAMTRQACDLIGGTPLTEEEALSCLAAWYNTDQGIPKLGELSAALRELRVTLLKKIFGQDQAVHTFIEGLFNAEVVAQADEQRKRPKAIFAFAGPPGVGKTYLAELGAEALGRPFKRFDMSAYSDHQAYMALVGFPPSFQAAKEGLLTGFVKENPGAFLLFDEIEKAHLTTINLFLQILDAGRLEDKFTSEDVTFRDTVIIFTTNAGASLYDRPNETGILAASASYHRRTILDALRTEKGPSGSPSFPAAICSRLATGYPVLFNHLGVNELEKIARAELERVGGLIEQQYYKAVTFDEAVPLALVLREGAETDARTVRSQSCIFLQTELFKFTDLYTRPRLARVWEQMEGVHIGIESGENGDRDLFEPGEPFKVLLVADEPLGDLYKEHFPQLTWYTASTAQDAFQTLASQEVDLVLLDIWLGRNPATLTFSGTVGQFDYAPLGARALAEGQECLRYIHERLPQLPVYLLSIVTSTEKESVDENLFLACVRSGGARGILATAFTETGMPDWQDRRDRFSASLEDLLRRLYREKRVRALGQERKVLGFETVPAIDRARRRVSIRLRDLRLSRAVSAEDAGEIVAEVERPTVRFADVFGAEAAKEALQFVVDWLRNPRRYAALGVRPPKGILLTGDPGTGKTMLARALAGESDVAFLVASGTDFVTIWQGSGPQNVRDLFSRARRYAPAIVFIDEIDAIGKKRMGSAVGRAEESTLNSLLTEMDGFGAPTMRPVIVLAATNLAEHLDEALRRRFDREIEVPPPDRAARAAYLCHELLNRQSSQVTREAIESLAGRSAGMTIAGLRRIVNQAAVMAAQQDSLLTDAILEEAFERTRMGEAGAAPDPATLERIARHEAGHALIGWLTGNPPVQVTIVGRGSAGGYVEKEVREDKIIYTCPELENLICQGMGGRAAELLYYGEVDGLSSGVSSDLRNATLLAARMIVEFGMSPDLGQVFLDEQTRREGPLAERINTAAERIVRGQLERAGEILQINRARLDRLSCELLARNRLVRADLERILA